MNLTHLRFVQRVAETASFSRAASQCHVTQASLSNAVSQLEDTLGARIFSRTTRKVEITPFGERILPMIAGVLAAADDLQKSAKEYLNPSYKIIRLGLTPLIDTRVVASILDPFHGRFPAVDVIFKECYLNDMQQRLSDGTIDFAFGPSRVLDKRAGRISFHNEALFYLPKNPSSPSIASGPVRLEQIAKETFSLSVGCGLADWTRQIFRKHRFKLKEYPGQALSYKVMEDWAGLGVAAAILPESKISSINRTARPLHDAKGPILISYEIAWNRKPSHRLEHIQELLTHFYNTASKITGGMARLA